MDEELASDPDDSSQQPIAGKAHLAGARSLELDSRGTVSATWKSKERMEIVSNRSIRSAARPGAEFMLLLALSCGQSPDLPRRADDRPTTRPGSRWFVVNPAESEIVARSGEDRILFNAIAPVLLERSEFVMPDRDSPEAWYGVIIVHTIVGPNGRIARAQIDEGPAMPGLEEAVAGCLRDWRFEPAHLPNDGPRAVHYYIRLPVFPPRSARSGPPSTTDFDWLIVDAAEDAAIDGDCVRALGFDGTPPIPFERPPLELPTGTNPGRRLVIVETVIGPSGRVARVRIVEGSAGPEVERAVVRTLAGWRFEPARGRDTREPVAIRWVVTPRLAEEQPPIPATGPPGAEPGSG